MRINANTVYHVCKPLAESPINIFKTGSSLGARAANLCVALALLCTGAFIPVGAAYLYSKHIVDLKSKDIDKILRPSVIATATKTDTTAKASFNRDDLDQDVLADKLVELVPDMHGIDSPLAVLLDNNRVEQFARGFNALTFEAQKDFFRKVIDNDSLQAALYLVPSETKRLNLASYGGIQTWLRDMLTFGFVGIGKRSTENTYTIIRFLVRLKKKFNNLEEVSLDFRCGSPVNASTLFYLSNYPNEVYTDNEIGEMSINALDFSKSDILIRATTYNISNALKFLEDRAQKRPENSTHSDVIMLDGYTRTFEKEDEHSPKRNEFEALGLGWGNESDTLNNYIEGKTTARDVTEQQKDTVANILGSAKDVANKGVANPNTAPEGCSKPDDYKAFKKKVIDEQAKGTKANLNPGYYFGLDNNDPASIKKAYLKLALVIHPDKFPNLAENSAEKKEVVTLFQCMTALNEIVNPLTTTT